MLIIIFDPLCELYYFSDYLDIYYKCLTIPFDVPVLIRDARKLFYLLYDKYAKFYGLSLNINIEHDAFKRKLESTKLIRVIRCYFKKPKNHKVLLHHQHKAQTSSFKAI